jgi:hypothetical protein
MNSSEVTMKIEIREMTTVDDATAFRTLNEEWIYEDLLAGGEGRRNTRQPTTDDRRQRGASFHDVG